MNNNLPFNQHWQWLPAEKIRSLLWKEIDHQRTILQIQDNYLTAPSLTLVRSVDNGKWRKKEEHLTSQGQKNNLSMFAKLGVPAWGGWGGRVDNQKYFQVLRGAPYFNPTNWEREKVLHSTAVFWLLLKVESIQTLWKNRQKTALLDIIQGYRFICCCVLLARK